MTACPNQELAPLKPCTIAAASIDAAQNGVDQVDVLFVIDNSGSMSEEQVKLSKELPRLVRVLASGDLDGVPNPDGQPDFQPVASLHLGVVSSDLGVNGQQGVHGAEIARRDPGHARDEGRRRGRRRAAPSAARLYRRQRSRPRPSGTAHGRGGQRFRRERRDHLDLRGRLRPGAHFSKDATERCKRDRQRIAFASASPLAPGALARVECVQNVLEVNQDGGRGAEAINTPCIDDGSGAPIGDDKCISLSTPGEALICVAGTCQLTCQSDAQCAAGNVCGADALGRGYCSDPTCPGVQEEAPDTSLITAPSPGATVPAGS